MPKEEHKHFRCNKREIGCCYCNSCGCERDLQERQKFGEIIREDETTI